MLDHRAHHRPPAHPELLGQLRYRPGVLTHLPARLGAGPAGQQHPGRHLRRGLRPGLRLTIGIPAPPTPLTPHQPRRPTETSQIADRHRHPLMRDGRHSARNTRGPLDRRLDLNDQLVGPLTHRQDPEAVQSQQRLGQPSSVIHAGVLLIVNAFEQHDDGGIPASRWWIPPDLPVPTQTRRARFAHRRRRRGQPRAPVTGMMQRPIRS